MIVKHTELADYFLSHMKDEPFMARLDKCEILHDLSATALKEFFSYDAALGLYISGGRYEDGGDRQVETVKLVFVLGQRDVSTNSASLGTRYEFGAWDLLEELRAFICRWREFTPANLSQVSLTAWNSLLAQDGMSVLGLTAEVGLVRDLMPYPAYLEI